MKVIRLIGWSVIAASLAGCSNMSSPFGPKPDDPEFAPAKPIIEEPRRVTNGSIYQPGYELVLYEDYKARKVGDIITIVFDETTNASKKADTTIDKSTDITLPNPTLLGSTPSFALPLIGKSDKTLDFTVDSDTKFAGTGDVKQSNTLEGRISVTVTDVLSNGNLMVKGEKWVTLNNGDEYVRISGIVRQADVEPDNTVLSSRVANARIAYAGKGDMANSNKLGWVLKVLNSAFWLF